MRQPTTKNQENRNKNKKTKIFKKPDVLFCKFKSLSNPSITILLQVTTMSKELKRRGSFLKMVLSTLVSGILREERAAEESRFGSMDLSTKDIG